jgi:hypothetical protein
MATARGFEITYKSPGDKGTELFKYDAPQYDHLILFAPESNKGEASFGALSASFDQG